MPVPTSFTTLPTNREDDTDSKSGADLGVSGTTGAHAGDHNTIHEAVMALERDRAAMVRAASTANVNTASPGATMDGVTLASGDRVLLRMQTTPSQNGIWVWNGAAAAMTRPLDGVDPYVHAGSIVRVTEGSENKVTEWMQVNAAAITVGTTAQYWTRTYPSYASDLVSTSSPFGVNAGFLRTNMKLENPPRHVTALSNTAVLASGTVRVCPLGILRAGDSLTQISFWSATTALATPTAEWAGIARLSDRAVLARSNNVTTAWAANSEKSFPFSATFTAEKDELLVAFLMIAATTVPSLFAFNQGHLNLMSSPIICGISNTGQGTTPLAVGATMTAFTADTENPYCYAS